MPRVTRMLCMARELARRPVDCTARAVDLLVDAGVGEWVHFFDARAAAFRVSLFCYRGPRSQAERAFRLMHR